mgnify:CR=1 FL=1
MKKNGKRAKYTADLVHGNMNKPLMKHVRNVAFVESGLHAEAMNTRHSEMHDDESAIAKAAAKRAAKAAKNAKRLNASA